MSCCHAELTLDQLLADPLTEAVMKADRLDRDDVAIMLHAVAESFAADQLPRTGSVIGRLVTMLAAHYDAMLCGRPPSERRLRTCKAS